MCSKQTSNPGSNFYQMDQLKPNGSRSVVEVCETKEVKGIIYNEEFYPLPIPGKILSQIFNENYTESLTFGKNKEWIFNCPNIPNVTRWEHKGKYYMKKDDIPVNVPTQGSARTQLECSELLQTVLKICQENDPKKLTITLEF